MPKRSFPVEIVFAAMGLPKARPISGGDHYVQHDQPITFLHIHDCLEIGYCFRGSGVFVVGEKILPFQAGDVSFINHAEPHLACSVPGTDSEWTWIYVDPIAFAGAFAGVGGADVSLLDPTPFAGPHFENLMHAADTPEINRIVLRMVGELRGKQKGYLSVLRALTMEVMVLMHRASPDAGKGRKTPAANYDRLAPAMQYLAHRYADPIDIAALAQRCKLSEPHFRRLFLASIGRSPRAYWHDLRMRMAASLLRTTSRPILQIGLDVGFETLSSFNRVFRDTFDTTPRAWRKSG